MKKRLCLLALPLALLLLLGGEDGNHELMFALLFLLM